MTAHTSRLGQLLHHFLGELDPTLFQHITYEEDIPPLFTYHELHYFMCSETPQNTVPLKVAQVVPGLVVPSSY